MSNKKFFSTNFIKYTIACVAILIAYKVAVKYTSTELNISSQNAHPSPLLKNDEIMTLEKNAYDAVYVISLDRTPDRYQKMLSRFQNSGIKLKRFKAVDGYTIKIINKQNGKTTIGKDVVKSFRADSWAHRPITYSIVDDSNKESAFDLEIKNRKFSVGEIGCAYSHRAIWLDIVKHGYKKAIIFEDDVIPCKNFGNILPDILESIPENFDIAFIGIGCRKDKYMPYINVAQAMNNFDHIDNDKHFLKISKTNLCYGAFAYVIGEKGANTLLKNTKILKYPIDDIMFHIDLVSTDTLNLFATKKKLITISDTTSEIKSMGRPF